MINIKKSFRNYITLFLSLKARNEFMLKTLNKGKVNIYFIKSQRLSSTTQTGENKNFPICNFK